MPALVSMQGTRSVVWKLGLVVEHIQEAIIGRRGLVERGLRGAFRACSCLTGFNSELDKLRQA